MYALPLLLAVPQPRDVLHELRGKLRFKKSTSIIAWHTSKTGQFNEFTVDTKTSDDRSLDSLGVWFTENAEVALHFGKTAKAHGYSPMILQARIHFRNPRVYKKYWDLLREWDVLSNPERRQSVSFWQAMSPDSSPLPPTTYSSNLMRDRLIKNGHDGIVIEHCGTDVPIIRRDFVVFNPHEIQMLRWWSLGGLQGHLQ